MEEKRKTWGGKREGAGRPKGINYPYKAFSVKVPLVYHDRIRKAAEKCGLSVSKYIQKVVDETLDDDFRPE